MKISWKSIAIKYKNLNNKQKYIAGLVLIILIVIIGIFSKTGKDSGTNKSLETRRIPVVLTPAAVRTFERSIVTQGNLEAKNFAMVSPRIKGIIVAILVDEGDSVFAGKTKLFQTDSLKLEQTVEIQKNEIAVTQCAERQAAANLEKVTTDLNKAELDYKRFKSLFKKQAVTADAYEQQESRYKQLQAAQKLAKAQLALAAERVRQAEAALVISQKDLTDTTVYAPLTGKISLRLREPGEMGQPGGPVVRIDDVSVIEVSAYLPAQYYSKVTPGRTGMKVSVSGINVGQRIVSYKSPTINPKLRTFEVKCVLKNPPDGVVPGAIAQIEVILESREGLGVPSVAIQKRDNQSVVFIVKRESAHMVRVKTGLENDGWIEIMDGELLEKTPVVSMGQYLIEEGTPVSVQKGQM